MTRSGGSNSGEVTGGTSRVVGWYISKDEISEVADQTLENVLRTALAEAARRRWSRVRINRWFR